MEIEQSSFPFPPDAGLKRVDACYSKRDRFTLIHGVITKDLKVKCPVSSGHSSAFLSPLYEGRNSPPRQWHTV
jgi:hypothetical protein